MVNRGCLVYLFFILLFIPNAGWANQSYLNELVDKARAMQLAKRAEWHSLLHYKPNIFSGYTSQLVAKVFFNAPDGRENPEAELEATLSSFFSEVTETDKIQNPQCQFIARYSWLKKELDFNPRLLKEHSCKRFNEWFAAIQPKFLTLIFPAGTDNSPASMFGHTLIRLDREEFNEKSRLSAYAINFAADNAGEGGLMYALKGLFGGYPGKFSIVPYYEKVNQYNQMENRDIWEYQLDFSEQEIRTILEHTWELGPAYFQYYFFSQNCSYHLLSLFEVARPTLKLTSRFSLWAIPSDTVKVTLEGENLLKKVVYRPSARTKLQHTLKYLTVAEKGLVKDLANGVLDVKTSTLANLTPEKKVLVLETAHDFLLYKRVDEGVEGGEMRKRSFDILRERSKSDAKTNLPPVPVPAVRMDEGHSTSRITTGVADYKQSTIYEIQMRPAYHDLLDASDGYTTGAQINFFDLTLRYNQKTEEAYVQDFLMVDIFSLTPRNEFFKPVSWRAKTGIERLQFEKDGEAKNVYHITAGFGYTFGISSSFSLFTLVDAKIIYHDSIENNYAVAYGPQVGFLWNLTRGWNMWASYNEEYYFDNIHNTQVRHELINNFSLSRDTAIRLSVREYGIKPDASTETMFSLLWYL